MTESLRTLSSDELTPVIYRRQREDPRSEYSYMLDFWFWAFIGGLKLDESEAVPLDQVEQGVKGLLAKGSRLAYWSGGFDLGFHSNIIVNFKFNLPGDVKVVAGIEPNSYIENKGRVAQFDQITRLSAVGLLLHQEKRLGMVFPIPDREGLDANQFYDELVKKIGMYQRPGCYHLYSANDPYKEIKIERMIKPESWCCLQLMLNKQGEPFSTTKLLGLNKN